MTRKKLPSRRPCTSVSTRVMGNDVQLSFGVDDEGTIKEVFVNTTKFGTMFDVMARDTCVILSYMLQHGGIPDEVVLSCTKDEDGANQGIAGRVLEVLIATQAEIRKL